MSTVNPIQYCNIHSSDHHNDSLLERVWNRFSHVLNSEVIVKDIEIQDKILKEQRQQEIQNLSKKNAEITRMLTRYVL